MPLRARWINNKDAFILAISMENLDLIENFKLYNSILNYDKTPIIALIITK